MPYLARVILKLRLSKYDCDDKDKGINPNPALVKFISNALSFKEFSFIALGNNGYTFDIPIILLLY